MKDAESLNNARSSSHEIHLRVIDNREDSLVNAITIWLRQFLQNLNEYVVSFSLHLRINSEEFVDHCLGGE